MLTTADVAGRLNIDGRTVQLWASTGYLPAYKVGSVWRFDSDEVEAFIQGCKRQPWQRTVTRPVTPSFHRVDVVSRYEERLARKPGGRPRKARPVG